jgi:L-serine kinase (ADP)
MTGYDITLIEIARLRPTEEVDAAHVARLATDLQRDGCLRQPILVERTSLAILDGHHRYHAAMRLGLSRIAAILISYGDPRLSLLSWSARQFTPEEVIRAAESGKPLPRKSTRHVLTPPARDGVHKLASLGAA